MTASAPAESLDALRRRIADLRLLEQREGRQAPFEICLLRGGVGWSTPDPSPAVAEEIAELEAMGVNWIAFHPAGDEVAEIVDRVRAWGEAFGTAPAGAGGIR
jgi:L-alanine-DL-glutamate epimerase-like enolase superfamily enzyme